jgi:NADH dehydrogenase (ubiquinone) Fe-S protein 1
MLRSSVRQRASLQQLWGCLRSVQTSAGASQQPAPAQASDTIEVFVNDEPVNIPKGSTVLQACDAAGIDIPRCVPLLLWHHLQQ